MSQFYDYGVQIEGQQSIGLNDDAAAGSKRGGVDIETEKVYTIKEVSSILRISPQAVYKKMKHLTEVDNQFRNELKQVKVQGKIVKALTKRGLDLVSNTDEQPSEQPSFEPVNNEVDNQLTTMLFDTIEMLQKQLSVKDEQIKRLTEMNERNQELLHNQQVLNLKNLQALPSSPWGKVKEFFKGPDRGSSGR